MNAQPFSYWFKKNWYYHRLIARFFAFWIPPGMRVLHVGCTNGYVLAAIKPTYAVGIDTDTVALNEARLAHMAFDFYTNVAHIPRQEFDYILLSCSTMQVYDVQQFFEQLRVYCKPGTRILVDTYSYVWEPTLWFAQKVRLRRPTRFSNWLSKADLKNLLYVAGYDLVSQQAHILIPCYIPFISWLINTFIAPIPFINSLCLQQVLIARVPMAVDPESMRVSVIIPVRNERGNIEAAVTRCPPMGRSMELIFVEGHSRDGTLQEIERVITAYPHYDIKLLRQEGRGKADAVRKAFDHASGDVLMILDGDLTMPPEELPKFFHALMSGKGEFINGSRLVYGMESEAMRFLNLVANHGFALIFSWLLSQRVKDTLCGTKVLFAHDYRRIVHQRALFGNFDPFGDFDLLFGAARLSLKIIDMPIHYKSRQYGSTQISRFRHGILLMNMSIYGSFKFKFR